ncbi:MAG: SCP2 sterol-binding domain-containing protein [Deltaproteobacteria bacterium]
MSGFDLERHVTRALAEVLRARLGPAPMPGRVVVAIEAVEAGLWFFEIEGSGARLVGEVTPIDATLRAHRLDWIDLFEGVASMKAALVDGRLELEGDVAVASRVCRAIFD